LVLGQLADLADDEQALVQVVARPATGASKDGSPPASGSRRTTGIASAARARVPASWSATAARPA
jgi:hypothetical protein